MNKILKAMPKQIARVLLVLMIAGIAGHYFLELKMMLHGGYFFTDPVLNAKEIYLSLITGVILCTLAADMIVTRILDWIENKILARGENNE